MDECDWKEKKQCDHKPTTVDHVTNKATAKKREEKRREIDKEEKKTKNKPYWSDTITFRKIEIKTREPTDISCIVSGKKQLRLLHFSVHGP